MRLSAAQGVQQRPVEETDQVSAAVAAHRGRRGGRRLVGLLAGLALALSGLAGLGVAPATADSAPQNPQSPETPPTVSADALPTTQINGVVWSQVVVGNRVYAGGSFSSARPPGTSGGNVTRNNLLAYDITTGALVNSFAPSLNGQVLVVAVSPDKSRVYVGGEFTTVDGQSRRRIAAFNASTGALISSFAPPINYHVHGIVATNTTVYVGGNFGGVGNQDRANLAAFNASNGALLNWAPQATGGYVWTMAMNPEGTKIAVGGSFTALNGSSNPGYGLGMVDATTGANLPMAVNNHVRNGTTNGAITTLAADGDNVYGGGYTFGRSGGTWEGIFAASWDGGAVTWLNDCHGDSYSIHAEGDTIYSASHTHYCENIGAIYQGDGSVGSYPYYRALAMGKQTTGTVTWEPDSRYRNFEGQPRSSVLTWYPSLNAGTYTGQSQGPWSVAGNSDYIVMGGEFTRVNGQNQQGLVRFARPGIAPNNRGPSLFNTTYPLNVSSTEAGKVRINWATNEDMDNDYLTYRLYRDTQNGSGLIHTRQVRAHWWNHYGMGFTDSGVAPGSTHRYRVAVTDLFGNIANSPWTEVTVASSGTDSPYVASVEASEPTHWWRFGETSGTTSADGAGFQPLTSSGSVTRGVPGAIASDPNNRAIRFPGTSTTRAYTTTIDDPPDVFTVEAWFRTTSSSGGKIIGRGNRNTGNSTKHDRQLYLNNSGQVIFGVKPNASRLVVTSPGTGGDTVTGWPSAPTSGFLNGDIDEVAIYKRALSNAEVSAHHATGTAAPAHNFPPAASFTKQVNNLAVSVNSTSTDSDGTIASHSWNWGDGSPASSGSTASHTYATAGTYTITLTVTDDDGATSQRAQDVTVPEPPPGPRVTVDVLSATYAGGVRIGVAGTGFRAVTNPDDAGVNVGLAEAGQLPDVSSPENMDLFAATAWVTPAQLAEGDFAVQLTAPTAKLNRTKQYSVYSWQAHTHANTTQDTESPVTIDWSRLAAPSKVVAKVKKKPSTQRKRKLQVRVFGAGATPVGKVTLRLKKGSKQVRNATKRLVDGRAIWRLPRLGRGGYKVVAKYAGSAAHQPSRDVVRFRLTR